MSRLTALILTILVALTISAGHLSVEGAVTAISFSRHFNLDGAARLVDHDQARARTFRSHALRSTGSFSANHIVNTPITNALVIYLADVDIGTPPTTYQLIVDTGSSNTWIGAGTAYVPTKSSVKTHNNVSVSYASGSFSGAEYLDTVSLGPGLSVRSQPIGVASRSVGFLGYDGILGFGPATLSIGTLSPDTNTSIPTVTDSLYAQGKIKAKIFGVSFRPTTNEHGAINGEISYGGVDPSKFKYPIRWARRTQFGPARLFWGFDMSIQMGPDTILKRSAGIADTGTSLILISDDAFKIYQSRTKSIFNETVGLLEIKPAQIKTLQCLSFVIDGRSYELVPNAQIWPRTLNTLIGGDPAKIYLIVGALGNGPSGSGLDFVLGYTFLERFYSAYNLESRKIGFASTAWTRSTIN